MANYVQNTRKYEKWIKEGRGQGRNEDYKPWLHVREVPSHGLSVRMPSLKAGRVLQLFSLNEFFPALLAEHHPNVVDIREQFPLDPEKTRAIANQKNFAHPLSQDGDMVMTSDLLIDYAGWRVPRIVIQAKPLEEAEQDEATRRKLIIEKAYWDSKNVPFYVFHDQMFPRDVRNNLNWMLNPLWRTTPHEKLIYLANYYAEEFKLYPNDLLGHIATRLNSQLAENDPHYSAPATCFTEIRELIAKQYLRFDLRKKIAYLRGHDIFLDHRILELKEAA